MLDHFLEVTYRAESAREESVKLASQLKALPVATLAKLATGQEKLSFDHHEDWLDKYRGSPLFEEALKLEHADLENEVARQQADAARHNDVFWKTQDQIRLQKKMLDLKLVEGQEHQDLQMGPGGLLPEGTPTAQGAGALGDVASESVQDGAMNGVGTKMAAYNFSKAAADPGFLSTVGKALTKNPARVGALVGAGIGAGSGALAAGEGHRLEGALGGAALGAGAGHVAGGVGQRILRGQGVADSLRGYGTGVKRNFKATAMRQGLIEGKGSIQPATRARVEAAAKAKGAPALAAAENAAAPAVVQSAENVVAPGALQSAEQAAAATANRPSSRRQIPRSARPVGEVAPAPASGSLAPAAAQRPQIEGASPVDPGAILAPGIGAPAPPARTVAPAAAMEPSLAEASSGAAQGGGVFDAIRQRFEPLARARAVEEGREVMPAIVGPMTANQRLNAAIAKEGSAHMLMAHFEASMRAAYDRLL